MFLCVLLFSCRKALLQCRLCVVDSFFLNRQTLGITDADEACCNGSNALKKNGDSANLFCNELALNLLRPR